MNIKDLTDAELELELENRRVERANAELPQPYNLIDTRRIKEFAIAVRDDLKNGIDSDANDDLHWAFEIIMESVFGKDYWQWARKQQK